MPWFRHLHIIAHFLVLSRGFFVFLAIFEFSAVILGDADEKAVERAAVEGDQRIEVASLSVDGLIARDQYQRQSRASDKAPKAEDGGGYQQ